MRIEYQKNIVNNLDRLESDRGFDWSELGKLLVEGGLPRMKSSARFDPDQFFALTKNNLHDEYEVQNIPYPRTHRFKKKKLYREPIDLYHHPRYLSLEYLRDVLTTLNISSSEDDIFKVVKLKKRIASLEYDLGLSQDQIVLPGTYYRYLSLPHYKLNRHYRYDPSRVGFSNSVAFYRTSLKKSSFTNSSPYTVDISTDIGNIHERGQSPSPMTDLNYWGLLYNTIFRGPSFISPFRRLLNRDKLKVKRKKDIRLITKSFRQHLQQVIYFRDFQIFKKSFLISSFSFYLLDLKDYQPYMSEFSTLIENVIIYKLKTYWRSLSIASSNRKYIVAPSKTVPTSYKFKIDISNFIIFDKKKNPILDSYSQIGSAIYDVGRFNLMRLITVGYKQLYSPSAYSEVPTAFTPFWTKSARTKKRVRLKDTIAGQQLQEFKLSILKTLRERLFLGPIYVKRTFGYTISEIALKFLNFETRHHYRIRSENSPYSTRERRLHRLLITQGVLFEYWDDSPTFFLPGQCTQLMLQNLSIDNEFKFKLPEEENLNINVISQDEKVVFPIFNDSKPIKQNLNIKLRGRYKLYMLLFTTKKYIYRILYYLIYFFKKGLRRLFFEIRVFFSFFSDFFEYLFIYLQDSYKQLKASPFFLRIQTIIAIWNTSLAVEDSMFDINDHLSSKFEYRRPFEAGVTENILPSVFELDYVDFDDDHSDEYEEISGASRLYTKWNFWLGFLEFGENFWDEIVDFFVVNLPYYILLIVRPIINILLIYPIWAIIDLINILYLQLKRDLTFSYNRLLESKISNLYKRILILFKWFLKSSLFLVYTIFWLTYLDYNDLQLLIVYTFDIPFHDFYYTCYVMLVVLSSFFFFGHHSFKSFIKNELGLENLIFLTTCTGSVTVQGYEIQPRPFLFTKQLYEHIRPKHTIDRYIPEHFTAQITNDSRGVGPAQIGSAHVTGQPLINHFSYDNLEFIVETQLWSNNPVGFASLANPRALTFFAYDEFEMEHPPTDMFDDSWYVGWLVSDLDSISTKSKSLKTPLTWYNNNEHYYNYHSYNRGGLLIGFNPMDYYGVSMAKANFIDVERSITSVVERQNRNILTRPGRLDPQTKRLDRAADPALFGSNIE